jgi:NAD(P)H-dependent flavin oxidoreductase YrpB (nitropropane dioxygenase family)
MSLPLIIQGGMGAAVSNWRLANAVSKAGQLGVVSGTAIGVILARRLQTGDVDGESRRALKHFPDQAIAARVLAEYFVPGGKAADAPFKNTPMPTVSSAKLLVDLTVAGSFVEVFLAKEGHSGIVGINLLEKIQLPTLPTLYGAMLAGVDYVLMGAGIPRTIPGMLDQLSRHEAVELALAVEGGQPDESFTAQFDPSPYSQGMPPLLRPKFLAIVASATLAITLARKSNGRVDGFVVEGETAGGHNAPPRGAMQLSDVGEPIYSVRDVPDLEKIRALGLPFWMAGSFGQPGKLAEAQALGAAGIQVGTAFAFCEESGICSELKQRAVQLSREGKARVFTDPLASPTGFPFKVAQMDKTLSEAKTFAARDRICDLGYLRHLYRKPDGEIGYRCPAEPVEDYIRKGGKLEETLGRKCVCNGLVATVGMGQVRSDETELPLVTAGNEFEHIADFLKPGEESYTAADVLKVLLGK